MDSANKDRAHFVFNVAYELQVLIPISNCTHMGKRVNGRLLLVDCDGSSAIRSRSNGNNPRLTSSLSANRNLAFCTVNASVQFSILCILPTSLLLLCRNRSSCGAVGTIGHISSHSFCISCTQVGHIGRLTAALQLGGEHRDGDGGQHGQRTLSCTPKCY